MSRTISGTSTSAVFLASGNDPVTVTATAKISASSYAIFGGGGATTWTIVNSGFLFGANSTGIKLGAPTSRTGSDAVTNTTGGTIAGLNGIAFYTGLGAVGVVTNQVGGLISGSSVGVILEAIASVSNMGVINGAANAGIDANAGGTIFNGAGGTISGDLFGVELGAAMTITNAGTISSPTGNAISSPFAGRLIVDPGAVFVGAVYEQGGTLELASAASAGTLSMTNFTGFSAIDFDAGSRWTITAGTTALSGTISGFTAQDTIDLTGFVASTETFASNALVLGNSSGGNATLALQGAFNTGEFHITPDGTGGTDIVLCFAAGTRIATPAGAVAVEDLREGDLVTSHLGDPAPVRWIGRRRIDCTRHPHPEQAWPVRVQAHALGRDCPERDLFLSPNHAVYIDDVLIPIRCLIDGDAIAQVPRDLVVYYHIELPQHDILLAEGLPAESYPDLDDRANFENSEGAMRLFPDFAREPDALARAWEMLVCAPLVLRGPALEAARARVTTRTRALAVAA